MLNCAAGSVSGSLCSWSLTALGAILVRECAALSNRIVYSNGATNLRTVQFVSECTQAVRLTICKCTPNEALAAKPLSVIVISLSKGNFFSLWITKMLLLTLDKARLPAANLSNYISWPQLYIEWTHMRVVSIYSPYSVQKSVFLVYLYQ